MFAGLFYISFFVLILLLLFGWIVILFVFTYVPVDFDNYMVNSTGL